jgi:putative heme iron utilization protein
MTILGEGQARSVVEVERAYAKAQADMITAIREVVEQHQGVDPAVVADMAVLRFIQALEQMTYRPEVQKALPAETAEMLSYFRRSPA